ncbi:hypothetical protein O1M54_02370 [Streptomyces diastatochromogenes]|nr:hypothetical protein [Streptomyces diastatochromogenes]
MDEPEGRFDTAGQFDGARRGLDAAAGAGEQLVVEESAQAAEGGAGGALAEVQGGGGLVTLRSRIRAAKTTSRLRSALRNSVS